MSDLHVECLRYRLTVDETYGRFENPPPLEHETDTYRMWLEAGVLTIEMKEHHATVESARRRVENDLRAWELDAALARDHTWMRFDYDPSGAKIIDRDPPPPGQVSIAVGAVELSDLVCMTAVAAAPVFKEYPKPPAMFEASLDVEGLFRRYERAVWLDPTQMLSFGYVCLSYLEGTTGLKRRKSRNEAAIRYRIDLDVLNKLGDLVSTRGDLQEARKLDADATRSPLTPNEEAWVRAAIKMLIRRKAEYDHDPNAATSLPIITMSDLPTL
jgi:hypothetical protein